MKHLSKTVGLLLLASIASACALSTSGLRPVKDHSLAWDAITEVYDEPVVEKHP